MKYDLMTDKEFQKLMKTTGITILDAYVHLIYDSEIVSTEELISFS